MTANRSQKAQVRAFAAERDISYTEARRLLGLSELHWEYLDAASGVRIEATMNANDLALLWFYPDGTKGWRFTRTHTLLGLDVWPSHATSAENPLFTSAGELRSSWDEAHVLPASATEQVKQWVSKNVQRPELLSDHEEAHVENSRLPTDPVVTVVDKATKQATVHIYRSGDQEAPKGSAIEVLDARSRRVSELEERAWAHLQAEVECVADESRFYTLNGGTVGDTDAQDVLNIWRFVVRAELRHDRAKHGVDPDVLRWSIVEHTDY